jgi:hypothetical protein
MVINPECLASLTVDAVNWAKRGYPDLSNADHPLASELRALPISELRRMQEFVNGALYVLEPNGSEPPASPSGEASELHPILMLKAALAFAFVLLIAAAGAYIGGTVLMTFIGGSQ